MDTKCKFCKKQINVEHRKYLANPFCANCYEQRLESSGAIDLRNNHIVIDLGNGYADIKPIDPNKKYKKSK